MIRFARFKGIDVCFTDEGSGRAIVFLHGFLENKSIWKQYSKQLSAKYRVIAIDLPGFGDTPTIGYLHNMELLAECVHAVMKSVGLRRYVIAGHSMGGYVTLAYAQLFEENVSGIILLNSTPRGDSDKKVAERNRVIEIVKRDARIFVSSFFSGLFAPENVARFRKEIALMQEDAEKLSRQSIVNALEGMKIRRDRRFVLKNGKFKTLIILGLQDAVIDFQKTAKVASLNKNIKVKKFENCGHMGLLEEKEAILKLTRRFAGSCFR